MCYDGTDLTPAKPYGLMNWAKAHVEEDPEVVGHAKECFNGIWRSTRELLLERNRTFYEGLIGQLDVSSSNEAVHYAERLVQLIFGGHGLRRRFRQRLLDRLKLKLQRSEEGGEACHVAIAVPYRNQLPLNDRARQLDLFVRAIEPFLKSMKDSTGCEGHVFVVEQSDDGRRFNRGFLANVGYHLATQRLPDLTSFIVHDVDLLPSDRLIQAYAEQPPDGQILHLAHVMAKYPNDSFIGGAFAIRPEDYRRVNGFPNTCWGWGNEDDYFRLRLNASNMTVRKMCQGSYNDIDPIDIGSSWAQGRISKDLLEQLNPVEVAADFAMPTQVDSLWRVDGVASAKFTVLETGTRAGGTVATFKVRLNEDVTLQG
mmetsp:Transcript_53274/g.165125  ORF Transcript_53274/g.165125 Transcript_53274/m.165125 type:complete len:370 (-) Transcript_53274:35-1144(-)